MERETLNLKEPMLKKYVEMLIEDYETGKINDLEEVMEILKCVINE